MSDYSELFKEEIQCQKVLEELIDGRYLRIIQLELEILELKKDIYKIIKKEKE